MTSNTAIALTGIVDLQRYPLDQLASTTGQAFLRRCNEQLTADGVCQLHGFLTDEAVSAMVDLATGLRDRAWASDQLHTPYFEDIDDTLDADDPRVRQLHTAQKAIAYDLIPDTAPIRRLYESDEFLAFVTAVIGKPVLYRSADPLDAVELAFFEAGDELGWHFDRSEFSVTIMFQPADAGGDFEYCTGLRSEHDENLPGVQAVLDGDLRSMRRLRTGPGTLAVFRGHHALHRVTPVSGSTPRLNTVVTFGDRPDMKLNELTQLQFYGRTA